MGQYEKLEMVVMNSKHERRTTTLLINEDFNELKGL